MSNPGVYVKAIHARVGDRQPPSGTHNTHNLTILVESASCHPRLISISVRWRSSCHTAPPHNLQSVESWRCAPHGMLHDQNKAWCCCVGCGRVTVAPQTLWLLCDINSFTSITILLSVNLTNSLFPPPLVSLARATHPYVCTSLTSVEDVAELRVCCSGQGCWDLLSDVCCCTMKFHCICNALQRDYRSQCNLGDQPVLYYLCILFKLFVSSSFFSHSLYKLLCPQLLSALYFLCS